MSSFMGFIHQPSWFQSRFHLGKIIEGSVSTRLMMVWSSKCDPLLLTAGLNLQNPPHMTSDTRGVKMMCCYSGPSQWRVQTGDGFRVWEVAHRFDWDVFKATRVETNESKWILTLFGFTLPLFHSPVPNHHLICRSSPAQVSNTCSEFESTEEAPDKLGWDDVHVRVELGLRCRRVPVVFILKITSDSGLFKIPLI